MKAVELWIEFEQDRQRVQQNAIAKEYPLPGRRMDENDQTGGKPDIHDLSADESEDFEERSAIIEYEAGLPREQAEQEALRLILKKRLAN